MVNEAGSHEFVDDIVLGFVLKLLDEPGDNLLVVLLLLGNRCPTTDQGQHA